MRRAIVPLLVAITTACSLLTSFDGFDEPRGVATDASTEEAGDAGPPPGPCFHKRWPAPPTTGGPADLGELVVAVRALGLVSPDESSPYGFDLDNLCTCADRVACIGAQPGKPCDPVDSGTDNVASSLFSAFKMLTDAGGLDESGLKNGLATGHWGIVFKISGWNGEPDDPSVRLAVYNAVDVNPGADSGARFDGNDRWVLDETSSLGPIPSFFTTSAYVTGGVLVATLPRLVAKIRIPTFNDVWLLIPVEMTSAQIVARIRRVGAGAELTNGEIGGRFPASSFLALASSAGVCSGSVPYATVKTVLCDARDVPKEPGLDGRDTPCDSVSIGLAFDAIPAQVTADAGAVVDPTPCGDAAPMDDCR